MRAKVIRELIDEIRLLRAEYSAPIGTSSTQRRAGPSGD